MLAVNQRFLMMFYPYFRLQKRNGSTQVLIGDKMEKKKLFTKHMYFIIMAAPCDKWPDNVTHPDGPVDEGPLGQGAGAVHRLAVVLWPPGGRVNVDVVWVEGNGPGLHSIVNSAVQHPDPWVARGYR